MSFDEDETSLVLNAKDPYELNTYIVAHDCITLINFVSFVFLYFVYNYHM